MPRAPWMKWNPADFLSDPRVDELTPSQELLYRRLLEKCHLGGGKLSRKPALLRRFAHPESLETFDTDWRAVRRFFVDHPTDKKYLTNLRVLRDVDGATSVREAKSRGGKARSESGQRSQNGRFEPIHPGLPAENQQSPGEIQNSDTDTELEEERSKERSPGREDATPSATFFADPKAHAEATKRRAPSDGLTKEVRAFRDFYGMQVGIDLVGAPPRELMAAWRQRKAVGDTPRMIQDRLATWSKSEDWKKLGGRYRPNILKFLTSPRYHDCAAADAPTPVRSISNRGDLQRLSGDGWDDEERRKAVSRA